LALNKQIHIYSVDTGAFYTNNEKRLHWKLCNLKREKKELIKFINERHYEEFLIELLDNQDDFKTIMKAKSDEIRNHTIKLVGEYSNQRYEDIITILFDYKRYINYKNHLNQLINKTKKVLLVKLEKAVIYNKSHGKKHVRNLSVDAMTDKNIISVFDSSLTRMLGVKQNELSTAIIVVKVYYFDILKDLIQNGYTYDGERYKFFTSSAGQIRTKKTVFIKESLWDNFEKTLMCGLTMSKINAKGGINVNKYLAYLALSNSATDVWENFDIHKCIVVDDFETNVKGTVDFISDKTYKVERKEMEIPITHTDGCGMMLDSVSKKNFMARLPWVKGLLGVYNFKKFIELANEKEPNVNHGLVKDIYGKEHDIIKEDIKIIFTKSQFKMYKYYSSWDEYVDNFEKYNCQAGLCNLEEDHIKNAKINYQMVQTLNDMTNSELMELTRQSRQKIERVSTTVKSMLEVFGVTKYNINKTYLQQALEIYPELLNDIYTKDVLRGIKQSLVKNYKAAKLDIRGKYTFLLPDLYAFSEHLFLDEEKPQGLLANGEVSCRLYKGVDKLDCLRSPHLYREHAVRNNVVSPIISKWFQTDAIYTSCFDLISKILQFDVDGDRSLVVADKSLVAVAERHMNNVVPLYYEMKKADPVLLDGEKIYNGLNAAYTGGNIGAISNDITKIWNSCAVTEDALKAVKILCMENNFTIDYAKTLYKPTRPDKINALIKQYTKAKVPYFFMYAKDKTENQVEEINNSVVNKLDGIITDRRLKFSLKEFGKLDYTMLMNNPSIEIDNEIINTYTKLNRKYHYKVNMEDCDNKNMVHIATEIKDKMSTFKYSEIDITDMLVKQLYGLKHSRSKESLWFCYGDIIVNNLKRNIGNKTAVCQHCGKRFEKENEWQEYCIDCKGYQPMESKTIICSDCHKPFKVKGNVKNKKRCDKCQEEANKKRYLKYNQKRK